MLSACQYAEAARRKGRTKPSRCVRHIQGFQQPNLLIRNPGLSRGYPRSSPRKSPGRLTPKVFVAADAGDRHCSRRRKEADGGSVPGLHKSVSDSDTKTSKTATSTHLWCLLIS